MWTPPKKVPWYSSASRLSLGVFITSIELAVCSVLWLYLIVSSWLFYQYQEAHTSNCNTDVQKNFHSQGFQFRPLWDYRDKRGGDSQ